MENILLHSVRGIALGCTFARQTNNPIQKSFNERMASFSYALTMYNLNLPLTIVMSLLGPPVSCVLLPRGELDDNKVCKNIHLIHASITYVVLLYQGYRALPLFAVGSYLFCQLGEQQRLGWGFQYIYEFIGADFKPSRGAGVALGNPRAREIMERHQNREAWKKTLNLAFHRVSLVMILPIIIKIPDIYKAFREWQNRG